MINKLRPLFLAVSVIAAALLAYGVFTLPRPQGTESEGFSSARVVKDIEAIAKVPHSVAQPQERAAVREYLVKRLQELGADTVRILSYDSLTGPKNKHVVYTFDAHNIVAEFAPLHSNADPAADLMFVAHYDSRYSHLFARDTVWSCGAADDGYGVGVILETVSQLVKERQDWSQGVKVLFTDAEEPGMMGMSAMWEKDRAEFDNVGLMVNVEARGPWGPALLFEACPGNEKVIDLYASAARYPYTYSLTTVVYKFMPNFTDFTIVKDSIPGLNFSTVADVNHYHTHLDNISNISQKSIQHYGEQILPLAKEYLLNPEYVSADAMKADADAVNFTIPALGLLNFSKIGYVIVNVVIFLLFLLVFGLEGVRGRLNARKVFTKSLVVLASALGMLVVGTFISCVCSSVAGVPFKLFGTLQGIMFDNVAMIISEILMFAVCVLLYILARAKAVRKSSGSMRQSASANAARNHAYNLMYGVMALLFILSIALLIALGENMMFLIPLAFGTVAMILYHLTGLKVWLPTAIAFVLMHAFSFYYALSMALTIGALGAVMMLSLLVIMLVIPMADIYLMPSRKK